MWAAGRLAQIPDDALTPKELRARDKAREKARTKALVRAVRDLAAHEGLARFRKPHYPDMHACGCNHAVELQHVKYGDAVGFVCERDAADKKPGYDADKCGPVCSNEAGKQLIHFCPDGYLPTCKGCSPQAEFDEL